MPFLSVYIHCVWSTKNRFPFFSSKETRFKVWEHIRSNARSKEIFIDCIGGYQEHCHCLISLGVNQSIQKVMQMIKGESSHWINKSNLTSEKFEWQSEYFASSVSKSQIDKVRQYIKNQESHHAKTTFQDEYDAFMDRYGFEGMKG